MRSNRQSAIVISILQELLTRNRNSHGREGRQKVIALLFPHMNGMDEGLKGLKEIRELYGRNVRIQVCPDDSVLRSYQMTDLADRTGIDDWISLDMAETQYEQTDLFFLPVLPFSVVSDLLRFNDSRQSIRLLLWALMSGKKVGAFAAGADPYHSVWRQAGLHHGTAFMKHEMKSQLQKLKGFGVELLADPSEFQKLLSLSIQREKKQLVTAETIRERAKAGIPFIEIGQGMIVTPLARDLAKELQVEINERRAGDIIGNGNRGWKSNGNKER